MTICLSTPHANTILWLKYFYRTSEQSSRKEMEIQIQRVNPHRRHSISTLNNMIREFCYSFPFFFFSSTRPYILGTSSVSGEITPGPEPWWLSSRSEKERGFDNTNPDPVRQGKVIKDTWFELFSHTSYDSLKCVVLISSSFFFFVQLRTLSIREHQLGVYETSLFFVSVLMCLCVEWRFFFAFALCLLCWHLCNAEKSAK